MRARAIMVLGALMAAGAILLWGCSGTYTWGPNGNSLTMGLDPSRIDPGVLAHGQTFVENHWLDDH